MAKENGKKVEKPKNKGQYKPFNGSFKVFDRVLDTLGEKKIKK